MSRDLGTQGLRIGSTGCSDQLVKRTDLSRLDVIHISLLNALNSFTSSRSAECARTTLHCKAAQLNFVLAILTHGYAEFTIDSVSGMRATPGAMGMQLS